MDQVVDGTDEEADFLTLLNVAERGDAKARREALEELGNTSLYYIPTPNLQEVLDRLMNLASDPVIQAISLTVLALQARELARPGEMIPRGYREKLVDHFLRFAQESYARTCEASASSLGTIGPIIPAPRREEVVAHLMNLSHSAAPETRKAAAGALSALASIVPDSPPYNRVISIIPEQLIGNVARRLLELTQDADIGVATTAVTSLGMMQESIQVALQPEVLEKILRLLGHQDARVREAAIFSLGKLDFLIPEERLRQYAAALLDLTHDPSHDVRGHALSSWFWGQNRVPEDLLRIVVRRILETSRDVDPLLRRYALSSFVSINFRDRVPIDMIPELSDRLVDLLTDPDESTRTYSRHALEHYRTILPVERRESIEKALERTRVHF